MRCETCQGSGERKFFIHGSLRSGEEYIAHDKPVPLTVPCLDCNGSGISHCCDGIQEQRDPGDETADLPDWEDLRGCAPGATGTLNSEDFVRELRDAWPDRLDEIERDVTGCETVECDCALPNCSAPDAGQYCKLLSGLKSGELRLGRDMGLISRNWSPIQIDWRKTLEKAREFNALPDTHDKWRSLNDE